MRPYFAQLLLLLIAVDYQVEARNKVVMCYYTNWSQYRTGRQFYPEQIDPTYCTHLVYAFAKLSANTLQTLEWNEILTYTNGLYKRFNALKERKPGLKTLLAVGGFSARSERFSAMTSTAANRQEFVTEAITYLRDNDFDGLDLDWEYPAHADQGGRPQDKANLALLVQDLRKGFNAEGVATGRPTLLLTAAVGAGYSIVSNGYDIPALNSNLDYINVMAYDLHGAWDSITGHNAGLYTSSTDRDRFSVSEVTENWIKGGAWRDKTLVGLATYGRTWTLRSSADSRVGASAQGPGSSGRYSQEAGFLTYYEICETALRGGYTLRFDQEAKSPYAYKDSQWISYEDITSLQYKMTWLLQGGYGGAIVWAIELDDFDGNSCGQGLFPLLRTIGGCLINGQSCAPNDGGVITSPPLTAMATTPRPIITTYASRSPVRVSPSTFIPRPTTLATRTPQQTSLAQSWTGDQQCPASYGFFRDRQDCSVFWFCWLPHKWRYVCAPGTKFDQRYFVCSDNSDCINYL